MFRLTSALILLTPIACFGDIPESIVGRWQFDSFRTMAEFMDQVLEANPDLATQIQEQKWDTSAQTDQQLTATITEDTISMVNKTSRTKKNMSYKVIGGNSRLIVIDATTPDGYNFAINIRFVEGGIAMETHDCQSNPKLCERVHRPRQPQQAGNATITVVSGDLEKRPARERPGPTQPQWIYFRLLPSSSAER